MGEPIRLDAARVDRLLTTWSEGLARTLRNTQGMTAERLTETWCVRLIHACLAEAYGKGYEDATRSAIAAIDRHREGT
jgi:hypothetical protein